MMTRYLLAILALSACAATPAMAQTPTLATVKGPLTAAEKAAGAPAPTDAKTWADWTRRLNALPALIAKASPAIDSGPVAGQPAGFNAVWYLAQNPDVRAAGMNPLQHWLNNGRWEGRLQFAGAGPFVPTAIDYREAPACSVELQSAWVPSDERQVRVRARLVRRGGVPCG